MPPKVMLNHMPASGISPVSGFRLQCIEFTEPLLVQVVNTAHSGLAPAPRRSSLPSRLEASATGRSCSATAGSLSKVIAQPSFTRQSTVITAKITSACFLCFVIMPNIQTQPIGMITRLMHSMMLL